MQKIDLDNATAIGSAWYDPVQKRFYGGSMGTYKGGILTDVSEIEAKVVLEELLGLARPLYTLDAAVRSINTPELVLSVDTETMDYKDSTTPLEPLIESKIASKTFARTNFECDLYEVHIVVEDRAAKKASHDVLRLNIEDAARQLAYIRNYIIAVVLHTATEIITEEEWEDMTSGVSDHNPMNLVGQAITTIECNGYPVEYMAVNPADWSNFINNSNISRLVQAGLMNVGENPVITLPGYPRVKVLVDCGITAGNAIIGSSRAVIMADGPTESVRYRNELKRYTGYIIRQYMQPKKVIAAAIRELTEISSD